MAVVVDAQVGGGGGDGIAGIAYPGGDVGVLDAEEFGAHEGCGGVSGGEGVAGAAVGASLAHGVFQSLGEGGHGGEGDEVYAHAVDESAGALAVVECVEGEHGGGGDVLEVVVDGGTDAPAGREGVLDDVALFAQPAVAGGEG